MGEAARKQLSWRRQFTPPGSPSCCPKPVGPLLCLHASLGEGCLEHLHSRPQAEFCVPKAGTGSCTEGHQDHMLMLKILRAILGCRGLLRRQPAPWPRVWKQRLGVSRTDGSAGIRTTTVSVTTSWEPAGPAVLRSCSLLPEYFICQSNSSSWNKLNNTEIYKEKCYHQPSSKASFPPTSQVPRADRRRCDPSRLLIYRIPVNSSDAIRRLRGDTPFAQSPPSG